jgi:hypothetical protein
MSDWDSPNGLLEQPISVLDSARLSEGQPVYLLAEIKKNDSSMCECSTPGRAQQRVRQVAPLRAVQGSEIDRELGHCDGV